jgi:hypothetical protein
MSNDMTIYDPNDDDGFGAEAADQGGRLIQGAILKFDINTGEYATSANSVPLGTEMDVHKVLALVQRWDPGPPRRCVDTKFRDPQTGKLPDVKQLGADESTWIVGLDGKRENPWKEGRFLYLMDSRTGEIFTLVASGVGAIGAVRDLSAQIEVTRGKYPGALPMIELRNAPMKTRYGLKKKPFFRVKSWRGVSVNEGGGGKPKQVEQTPAKQITQQNPPAKVANEFFDDAVPF